jgi:hypothetical protein
MTESLKARAFRAFGDWCIRRAQRTPYFHLFHDDGRLYMERFWLLRIGMPRGWQDMERTVQKLQRRAKDPFLSDAARAHLQRQIDDLRVALYPRFGIRVHRIVSSDDRVFHDHPWNFASLILRGGYNEVTPITPDGVTGFVRRYEAGSFRRMRASQWHYLTLTPGEEAWTLFITGRKRQSWGFLVDGVKVPWRQYMARRAQAKRTTAA